MRFALEQIDALPRLAWCARVRRGADEVAIRHGPWVETRDDCFVEGAWDGSFEQGRPDQAIALAGTGARATPGGVVFASSSSLHDRLYSARAGDELLVSNSLTFLLVEAADEPDPEYPYYAGDFMAHAFGGIRRRRRTIPTRRGVVAFHECGNIAVAPDLSVRRVEKRAPDAPVDYASYVRLLEETIGRVLENAADPLRVQSYAPLATLSRGYDAPAVAALARRVGCTEAVTFAESTPGSPNRDDNGKPIGVRLGMNVTEFARRTYEDRPECLEAEFCVSPPGADVAMASMEERLVGSLILTGRFGDDVWTRDSAQILPDLRQHTAAGLAGSSMTEFRLRVGFLHFAPLFTGAQHIVRIHRIAASEGMRPWSVGGSYDRPIARRILEEAGVPRGLFGRKKMAGAVLPLTRVVHMRQSSREDFLAFGAAQRHSGWLLRKALLLRALYRLDRRVSGHLVKIAGALGKPVHLSPLVSPRYSQRPDATWLFRWGFHRIKGRYQVR
jgi:hypothetical protein